MINLFIAQNKPINTLKKVSIDFSGLLNGSYISRIMAIASEAVDTDISCIIRVTKENDSGLPTYDQKTVNIITGRTIGEVHILPTEKITTFSVNSITPTQSSTQQYVIGEVIAPN